MNESTIEHNGFKVDMKALEPTRTEQVLRESLTSIRNNDKDRMMTLIIEWNTHNRIFTDFKNIIPTILRDYDNFLKQKENDNVTK